jgi:hypothetical protein
MVPRVEVFVNGEQVGYFIDEPRSSYGPAQVIVGFYSADPYDTVLVRNRQAAIDLLVEYAEGEGI